MVKKIDFILLKIIIKTYPSLKSDCEALFSKLRYTALSNYQSNIVRGQITKDKKDTEAIRKEFVRGLRSSMFENRQSLVTDI